MTPHNGKEFSNMSNKTPYHGNARFLELGSPDQPFRSLVNIDHLSNCRFEQDIRHSDIPAQYDADGSMTAPPQQSDPFLVGWKVVLLFDAPQQTQAISFTVEEQAIHMYNLILDMISNAGVPVSRCSKLKPMPKPSGLVDADGNPVEAAGNDDGYLPDEDDAPELTDDELDQLEHPEIDVDAIADAIEEGVGDDKF
jgi:hypothetical protein